METQEQILKQLQDYFKNYPNEEQELTTLTQFVLSFDGEQLFDRKNFKGHLTASAFIIDAENEAVLLLKHKALNRWLQPGGHIDVTDKNLLNAALREATEETGLSADTLTPVTPTIFDFDSHMIPANAKKQELAHFHHDVRFLFSCAANSTIKIAEEESIGSKWIYYEDLKDDTVFGKVVKKIKAVMAKERV